jgi:predicted alternative tryptophan synthase beta-subunit
MSAAEIAKRHLEAALAEATAAGYGADATARYMLGSVVQKYLEYRTVADVRSELQFVAENCDPETDFMFMRP